MKQALIVICSKTPEAEAAAMFAEMRMDFKKFVAAYGAPEKFGELLKTFLPKHSKSQEAPLHESPGATPPTPRLVSVNLLLASDDPEWPRFLSKRCDLHGSVMSKYPPSPETMKAGWPRIPCSVFVDPVHFVEAVRAYEATFDRKALIKKGSAVIGLEGISDGCTLSFTAPDAPRSGGG